MFESIGQELSKARQSRDLSLEQVSRETRIRLHYLEALEGGDFERLPSRAQARGFLRAYAGYLGLKPEGLLARLDQAPSVPANGVETQPGEISQEPALAAVGAQAPAGKDREFFEEIGRKLRHQRELLGLNLEDIARHTHLRVHYLEALEAGNLDGLPSPVQGRGMLHNYATFLGMDPEPLLLRFADGLQSRLAARQVSRPRSEPVRQAQKKPSRLRRLFSTDILLSGMLVVSISAFVIWGVIRINAMRGEASLTPTLPSMADALLPTEAGTPEALVLSPMPAGAGTPVTDLVATPVEVVQEQVTPTPQLTADTGEPTVEAGSGGQVQVRLVVRARTWARVTVDGKIEFQGRMLPGSAFTFTGRDQVEILTGNGAALQVVFNQSDLGQMGVYGEVVSRVFTPEGMVQPTPTITPVPTDTPEASPIPAESDVTPTPTLAP